MKCHFEKEIDSIVLNLGFKAPCNFFLFLHSSLADQKKEEGNQHYLAKNYREALQRYNEAISKFGHFECIRTGL